LGLTVSWPGRPETAAKEHATALLKRKPGNEGRPSAGKLTNLVGLSTGGTDRQAAQLAKRRPDLAMTVHGNATGPY
jgi:hypothetical protein